MKEPLSGESRRGANALVGAVVAGAGVEPATFRFSGRVWRRMRLLVQGAGVPVR
ncbi:hypothetical protein STXM2123_5280 [Streptomyces sp. F-3]|nr:hypothetical protein STXM2123_5280 [Streptomyces sp. F-3]